MNDTEWQNATPAERNAHIEAYRAAWEREFGHGPDQNVHEAAVAYAAGRGYDPEPPPHGDEEENEEAEAANE